MNKKLNIMVYKYSKNLHFMRILCVKMNGKYRTVNIVTGFDNFA